MRYPTAQAMRQALDAILTQPVARVDAEAPHAPAALPTAARPQPGSRGRPYRSQSAAISAPVQSSSRNSALVWVALLVLAVFGGIIWLVLVPPGVQSKVTQGGQINLGEASHGLPEWSAKRGYPQSEATGPVTANSSPTSAKGTVKTISNSDTANKDQPFVNSLGMKFVPVPGTDVLFCIWVTRLQDYERFALATNREISRSSQYNQFGPTHPITMVTWYDANAFCEWLTKEEGGKGLIQAEYEYRLPTDEEWSLAVGLPRESGSTPKSKSDRVGGYPWGVEATPPQGFGNFAGEGEAGSNPAFTQMQINGYKDGYRYTSPVDAFPPNQHGLFDMFGNVYQYVENWYDETQDSHTLRGTSFWGYLNPTSRRGSDKLRNKADFNVGFRCVLAHTAASTTNQGKDVQLSGAGELFVNSLGMKFTPVDGVKVLFCIHETRRKDYATYAAENPGVDSQWSKLYSDKLPYIKTENDPVYLVNWSDAVSFCDWLSKKEGRTYRLPTDREWSIAAGLDKQESEASTPSALNMPIPYKYPWGGQWPPGKGAGNFADISLSVKFPSETTIENYMDGYSSAAPVMSFKPNKYGLYDMAGNVWEWCADWSDESHSGKVLRGGSWDCASEPVLRSSYRFIRDPNGRNFLSGGFRCVVEKE